MAARLRIVLLAVFTAILSERSSAASKYPATISVEDYVVDKDTLHGPVSVKGSVTCIGAALCYLYGDNISVSVNFDSSKLPRDDRKRFLSCNLITAPCVITIFGKTSSSELASIIADSVAWEPTAEDLAAADPNIPSCDTVDTDSLKAMAESSPLAQMIHLKVLELKITASSDAANHKHCVVDMTTSAGDKKMRFFLQRRDDGGSGYSINGQWVL